MVKRRLLINNHMITREMWDDGEGWRKIFTSLYDVLGSEGNEMDKVEFGGLLVYYTITPPSQLNDYADVHIRLIVNKENMDALAEFLDGCLDDGRTSSDKFTITLNEKD